MVIDITEYGTYSDTVAGGVFTESGIDILQPLEPELGNASGGKRRDLRSWCIDDVLAIALSRRFLFWGENGFFVGAAFEMLFQTRHRYHPKGAGMKRILTIAGSDSGGGAGIQADLKTITVLGAYGMSAITALTAQNTLGVQGIHPVPVDFIVQQMESVLSDIGADAAKTGMLATPEIVRAVAGQVKRFRVEHLVVDPVMTAKSGDLLLSKAAQVAMTEALLPLAHVVTPNLPEASEFCGFPVMDLKAMKAAARKIHGMGPRYVLVKGGHLKGNAVDILFDGENFEVFGGPRLNRRNTHGTGCTFSAALATLLAQGAAVSEAVEGAKKFITRAIDTGLDLGGGHGPTNHFAHVLELMERERARQALQTDIQSRPAGERGHFDSANPSTSKMRRIHS